MGYRAYQDEAGLENDKGVGVYRPDDEVRVSIVDDVLDMTVVRMILVVMLVIQRISIKATF